MLSYVIFSYIVVVQFYIGFWIYQLYIYLYIYISGKNIRPLSKMKKKILLTVFNNKNQIYENYS